MAGRTNNRHARTTKKYFRLMMVIMNKYGENVCVLPQKEIRVECERPVGDIIWLWDL